MASDSQEHTATRSCLSKVVCLCAFIMKHSLKNTLKGGKIFDDVLLGLTEKRPFFLSFFAIPFLLFPI